MIVPMKKLSLLLYHREKERFLASLQELGVVHVVESPEMRSDDLDEMQNRRKAAERVVKSLRLLSKTAPKETTLQTTGDAEVVVRQFEELEARLEKIEQQSATLKKEALTLAPWGNFDPGAVKKLSGAGITLRFYQTTEKKFAALNTEGLSLEIITRSNATVYFVVFQKGEQVTVAADEVILPQISLQEARASIGRLAAEKSEREKEREKLVVYQEVLSRYLSELHTRVSLESARLSMEHAAEGALVNVTGWVPEEKENKVAEFLNGFSAWYEFKAPTPEDNVPVLLKNKKVSKLFEAITKIFVLPDYFELDPTPFFAPFFAMFFGLCLGDVGYGLIILIASLFALKKSPADQRPVFQLGMVLGFATMAAGFLLNTFFGMAIVALPGSEAALFKSGGALATLGPVETAKGTFFPAMTFSLYVGVIQILLGMALQSANKIRTSGMVYGIAPLATMLMTIGLTIFLAHVNFMDMGIYTFGMVSIGAWLNAVPPITVPILVGAGIVLTLLFNDPGIKLPARMGLGLWVLYNFLSGVVSNGLSYLRLFALGLAGGLLGAAFNDIAFMIIRNENGTVHYGSFLTIFTVLILVVGHTLNLGLSALGAFVHSLRLTFVEFYGNVGFKGGGKPYSPLSKS